MKKLFLSVTLLISSFILSSCTTKDKSSNSVTPTPDTSTPTNEITTESAQVDSLCQPKEVAIEGYGDKGKQLSNCFVEYPGEPSRQDKSYYIVEDICGQFTPDFISRTLGKNIIKTQSPYNGDAYYCQYYLDDTEVVLLALEYESVAERIKLRESAGFKVGEDSKIPMKNEVLYKSDGQLSDIYLILSDNKFIAIAWSDKTGLSENDLINFAANIAQDIKNYK